MLLKEDIFLLKTVKTPTRMKRKLLVTTLSYERFLLFLTHEIVLGMSLDILSCGLDRFESEQWPNPLKQLHFKWLAGNLKVKKKWCNNGPAAPLDKKKGSPRPPFPQRGLLSNVSLEKPRPEVQPSLLLYIPFIDRKRTPFICTCGIELNIVPLSLWSSWQQLFSSYYGEFDAVIRCFGLYYFREVRGRNL